MLASVTLLNYSVLSTFMGQYRPALKLKSRPLDTFMPATVQESNQKGLYLKGLNVDNKVLLHQTTMASLEEAIFTQAEALFHPQSILMILEGEQGFYVEKASGKSLDLALLQLSHPNGVALTALSHQLAVSSPDVSQEVLYFCDAEHKVFESTCAATKLPITPLRKSPARSFLAAPFFSKKKGKTYGLLFMTFAAPRFSLLDVIPAFALTLYATPRLSSFLEQRR